MIPQGSSENTYGISITPPCPFVTRIMHVGRLQKEEAKRQHVKEAAAEKPNAVAEWLDLLSSQVPLPPFPPPTRRLAPAELMLAL